MNLSARLDKLEESLGLTGEPPRLIAWEGSEPFAASVNGRVIGREEGESLEAFAFRVSNADGFPENYAHAPAREVLI